MAAEYPADTRQLTDWISEAFCRWDADPILSEWAANGLRHGTLLTLGLGACAWDARLRLFAIGSCSSA